MGPGVVGVTERAGGERLARPRAFSQSAMHSLERSERGNPQVLAELAQVIHTPTLAHFFSNVLSYIKNRVLSLKAQMACIHLYLSRSRSLSLSFLSLARYVGMGASFQAVGEHCLRSKGV